MAGRAMAALDATRLHDVDYWEVDLRLGEYKEIVALLDDDPGRLARVRGSFTTKRVLCLLADALGVSPRGSVKQLQARVSVQAEAAVLFLLVARFVPFKMPAAVTDIAEAVLGEEELEAARIDDDRYDRQALLLLLYLLLPHADHPRAA